MRAKRGDELVEWCDRAAGRLGLQISWIGAERCVALLRAVWARGPLANGVSARLHRAAHARLTGPFCHGTAGGA